MAPVSLPENPQSIRPHGERFVLLVLLVLIVAMAGRTPIDSDQWWHLRNGAETVRAGQPLWGDTFSYTRAGQTWVNHSWLAEVGMYELFHLGGYLALAAAVALLAAAGMALVYFQMEGRAILRAFLIVFGAAVMAPVWSPRPQMLSLLLLALLAWVLYSYRADSRDYRWSLPLLFAVWGNLHGGYALGLVLLGLWLAGEALDYFLEPRERTPADGRSLRRWLLWGGASMLALLANPYGLNILRVPFQTIGVSVLQQAVAEWASPDFHQLNQQPFLWLLLALAAAIGLSGQRLKGRELLPLMGFGYLALMARRNIGPFVIVSLPVLSRYVCLAYDAWRARAAGSSGFLLAKKLHHPLGGEDVPRLKGRLRQAINVGIVGILALAAAAKIYLVTQPAVVEPALAAGYPVGAVKWLEENHPAGRLFSEYQWGGYLEWFEPDYPVFVDGRTDLFGDEIIGQWLQVVQAEEGWQDVLDHWQVQLVLLQPGRPVLGRLADQGWRLLYQDGQSVLYGR